MLYIYMAEIKIERKAQRSLWPWIIGILLLLGLIVLLSLAFDDDRKQGAEDVEPLGQYQEPTRERESLILLA
jgi:hypothetical protein